MQSSLDGLAHWEMISLRLFEQKYEEMALSMSLLLAIVMTIITTMEMDEIPHVLLKPTGHVL